MLLNYYYSYDEPKQIGFMVQLTGGWYPGLQARS